jgi:hypothetical protein
LLGVDIKAAQSAKYVLDGVDQIIKESGLEAKPQQSTNAEVHSQRSSEAIVTLEETTTKRGTTKFDIKNLDGDTVGEISINEDTSISNFLSSSEVSKSSTTFTPKEFKSKVIIIESLWIDEDYRGKKYGISAINSIFNKYDRGSIIALDAYPTDDNMTKKELVKYYKSLGFVSRIKKYTGVEIMTADWDQIISDTGSDIKAANKETLDTMTTAEIKEQFAKMREEC